MRNNENWLVQLAVQLGVVLGLIGLIVTRFSFGWGVFMIVLSLAALGLALFLRQSGKVISARPRPKPAPRAVPAPRTVSAPKPAPRRADRNQLGVLRFTLHQAGLDSNAPVFEVSADRSVTVREILEEMIEIAGAHGRPIEDLARDITAMYPRIFENVNMALRQYPDEELAKTYIARKSMTDVGWRLRGNDFEDL